MNKKNKSTCLKILFLPLHVIFVVIIVLGSSCNKDFRDKWVGDWDFVINRHWWSGVGENYTEGDTVYYYLGKISIESTDNKLIIDYIGNISLVMTVDELGRLLTIKDHPLGYTGNGLFDGNNKIYIEREGGYGHGGGGKDIVNGIKKTKGGKNE